MLDTIKQNPNNLAVASLFILGVVLAISIGQLTNDDFDDDLESGFGRLRNIGGFIGGMLLLVTVLQIGMIIYNLTQKKWGWAAFWFFVSPLILMMVLLFALPATTTT